MKLTIATADDRVVTIEIDENDSIETLKAILEAETGHPASRQVLMHNGNVLQQQGSLQSSNVRDGDLLMLAAAPTAAVAGQQRRGNAGSNTASGSEVEIDALIEELKSLPQEQYHRIPADIREAIESNNKQKFAEGLKKIAEDRQRAEEEEARFLRLAQEDPFNPEVQKRLEEAIQQKNISENLEAALEYNPEVFGTVVMLYVPMQVNGVDVKAFVDSGAQTTIMNQKCAEKCGLLRLMDRRFTGVAKGVGSAKILGRIHMAPLQVKGKFFSISITVLEEGPEFLFGLDNLRRQQCQLDLKANVLRFPTSDVEIEFLPEHEIPKDDLFGHGGKDGNTIGNVGQKAAPQTNPDTASKSSPPSTSPQTGSSNSNFNEKIERLMGLGFPRQQCEAALKAADGNEDIAGSLLFGGL